MSTYGLQGTMSVSLSINGNDSPSIREMLHEYVIHAGFGYNAPSCTLTLLDRQGILTGVMAINDGTVITLKFGREGITRVLEMSVISKKGVETSVGQGMSLVCVLNKPSYVFGAQTEAYKGTSISAITSAASKSGIRVDADGVSPRDNMVWRNIGKSRAAFVSDILLHSYAGDDSVLASGLDVDGILRIRDLFKTIQSDPDFTMISGPLTEASTPPEKTVLVSELAPKQLSGLTNLMYNYGAVRTDNLLTGNTVSQTTAKPPVIGDGLPINQTMQESIQYTRMENAKYYDSGVGDIPGSNGHENYYKAPYLNNRFLSLFNQCLYALVDGYAGIPLLSCVDVKSFKQMGEGLYVDNSLSGKYVVGGVTLIGNAHYYSERYALYRCYVSESGNTPVLGSKNQQPSTGKPIATNNSNVDFNDPQNKKLMNAQASSSIKGVSLGDVEVPSTYQNVVNDTNSKIEDLAKSFKDQSSAFDLDFLVDKYGGGADYIMALSSEVGSAMKSLNVCSKLTNLEKLSLDFAKLNAGPLMNLLDGRLGALEELSSAFETAIRALVASGNISDGTAAPQIKTNCRDLRDDAVNNALDDKFSLRCMDRHASSQLSIPRMVMRKLTRAIEEALRDLICLVGTQ